MLNIDHDEVTTIYRLLEIAKEHIQQKKETSERWTKYFDCQVDAMLNGVDLLERLEVEMRKEAA